ncbi:precorrin-3B C(17)-methyltransferase [Pseudanabaena sp. PCC 6802]|uniref:precorrin-3B C(17)-methyltransferase n=1 Tax=Pseudanabaena sp. PCC 6802 TaxID=118173 RepID=UPI00034B9C6E|nr:precorrin-3B C(17)-methyltransferase [Pseudanabaena sp. PCC 6802]
MFNDRNIAGIAVTPTGTSLLQRLIEIEIQIVDTDLKSHLATIWTKYDGFVFCLATGAVVRLIAPLLQNKATDPAVVVVDEAGKFAISLCGGHLGGGDRLTRTIAAQLGAEAVITSASESVRLPAIDTLGEPFGWQRGTGDWNGVAGAIARQESIQIIQEAGSTLWQTALPPGHPFQFGWTESHEHTSANSPAARVWISPTQRRFSSDADVPKVQWHPRILWIGIGCERGTPRTLIERAIQQTCQANHLAEAAIAGIATIDLKADEVGLLEFCQSRNLSLRCFSSESLRAVDVPNPSIVVAAEVGTPSVAEAAAILAARMQDASNLSELESNSALHSHLLVPKQIFRRSEQSGAATVAIAVSQMELTGRQGRLLLVGIGPGALDQITPAARVALTQADAIVGYHLYAQLIEPLLHPGQIVETSPITQERQRAKRAVDLAQWGLSVAMISSGDCGIYGMAGLVMEELEARAWDGVAPSVEIYPGITALQAAAARVGTPLMHDFCAISLSDLLTPLETIRQRLVAAAQAGFVTAFYNPRSATRTEPMAIAHRIFLEHRHLDTPVALVRSAYRPDEQITLTTLGDLDINQIDMFTTVLIGNATTRFYQGKLITSRAYKNS